MSSVEFGQENVILFLEVQRNTEGDGCRFGICLTEKPVTMQLMRSLLSSYLDLLDIVEPIFSWWGIVIPAVVQRKPWLGVWSVWREPNIWPDTNLWKESRFNTIKMGLAIIISTRKLHTRWREEDFSSWHKYLTDKSKTNHC